MHNRNIFRDLAVYVITSTRLLLFKGKWREYFTDISYFFQWRKYRTSSKGTLDYRVPWLVFGSIGFLNQWLKKTMNVYEYGSGGSTLYFADHAGSVFSVEHDREWYSSAKAVISNQVLENLDYRLIEPVPINGTEPDYLEPANYVSSFREYKGYEFSSYARSIDSHPDESFDLVVVDGRVRTSCIMHSLLKIKKGGALLLDNADRSSYLTPFPALTNSNNWKQIIFEGHFPYGPASVLNTTMVFIKLQ
jgi:hypothetical protein